MPDPEIWALTSKNGWPKDRLQAAMPDIDELVRNVSVEPL